MVRTKWAIVLRSSFMGDDIPKATDTISSVGRSNLVQANRAERMAYLLTYLMRRPAFRMVAHVLEVLLHPAHASYLALSHESAWDGFVRRAKDFLTKEKFPSFMNLGDELVGSSVFHGVGGLSMPGYIYDRGLWDIPLSPLPPSCVQATDTPLHETGGGTFIAARESIYPWGRSQRQCLDDPTLERLFDIDETILSLWDAADRFLKEWHLVRVEEEDPSTGNLASIAPDVWGMKARPSVSRARTLGSDLVDYTVFGGQYATGPVARDLKGMLVAPLLNSVAPNGDDFPVTLWKSARSDASLSASAMVIPTPGSALAAANYVYVNPQNVEQRPFYTTDRFEPRTLRPVSDYRGEPDPVLVPRSKEVLRLLAAFRSEIEFANAVRRNPEAWAHLVELKDTKLEIVPGSPLFESSLTKQPFLVPVRIPRTGLITRIATWLGPPAGLRPYRGWFAGSDIEFDVLPYAMTVDVSPLATALAVELSAH
jgi:hypothetical protein